MRVGCRAAGTYVITKMIEIAQSNVVLRGAGVRLSSTCLCCGQQLPARSSVLTWAILAAVQVGQTILSFPKGLKAVYGNQMDCERAVVAFWLAAGAAACVCSRCHTLP